MYVKFGWISGRGALEHSDAVGRRAGLSSGRAFVGSDGLRFAPSPPADRDRLLSQDRRRADVSIETTAGVTLAAMKAGRRCVSHFLWPVCWRWVCRHTVATHYWPALSHLPSIFRYTGWNDSSNRSRWGHWAAVGSIVLMIVHSFVPVPAEILAVANGMVFGPIWGTIITWIGAMLGAYLAFGLFARSGTRTRFARTMVPERHWRTLDTWCV